MEPEKKPEVKELKPRPVYTEATEKDWEDFFAVQEDLDNLFDRWNAKQNVLRYVPETKKLLFYKQSLGFMYKIQGEKVVHAYGLFVLR